MEASSFELGEAEVVVKVVVPDPRRVREVAEGRPGPRVRAEASRDEGPHGLGDAVPGAAGVEGARGRGAGEDAALDVRVPRHRGAVVEGMAAREDEVGQDAGGPGVDLGRVDVVPTKAAAREELGGRVARRPRRVADVEDVAVVLRGGALESPRGAEVDEAQAPAPRVGEDDVLRLDVEVRDAVRVEVPGRDKGETCPNLLKPRISVVFDSFWLIFGRAIISWGELKAWTLSSRALLRSHPR